MRKSPLIALSVLTTGTLALLTACGGGGGETTQESKVDDGLIPTMVIPAPDDSGEVPGMDAELPTLAKAEDGWISAPWAVAATPDVDSKDLQIVYVDGDTQCYAHVGFALDESKSKVVLGTYVQKVSDEDCPEDPARAFKWGTIKLQDALGDRELTHAGLGEVYASFDWNKWITPLDAGTDEQPPAEGEGADEGTADEGADTEPAEGTEE
ncbi:MAG: hypothetical protein LBK95_01765 [Bifidobacteriaceae bacterium]|jgi:hypothetical protein|nr:hypothetical protein [Bifidobacteriaceae bacterium]